MRKIWISVLVYLTCLFVPLESLGQASRVISEAAEAAVSVARKAISKGTFRAAAQKIQSSSKGPVYSLSLVSDDTYELIGYNHDLTENIISDSLRKNNLATEIEKLGSVSGSIMIDESLFFEQKILFTSLSPLASLVVVLPDNTSYSVKCVSTTLGEELFLEVREGLLLQADTSALFRASLSELTRKLNKYDLEVIALLTDTDNKAIRSAAGEIQSFPGKPKGSFLTLLEQSNKRIIFLIGHIEERKFVIRNARNEVVEEILIDDLERIALKRKIDLVLLGCNAAQSSRSSGTVTSVNTKFIAERLREALNSESYEGMLTSFATAETPLLVRTSLIDQVSLVAELEKESWPKHTFSYLGIVIGSSAFLLSLNEDERKDGEGRARSREILALASILSIPSFSIFFLSQAWREFLGISPLLPLFKSSWESILLHTIRLISFVFYLFVYTVRKLILYASIVLIVTLSLVSIVAVSPILAFAGETVPLSNVASSIATGLKNLDARAWKSINYRIKSVWTLVF